MESDGKKSQLNVVSNPGKFKIFEIKSERALERCWKTKWAQELQRKKCKLLVGMLSKDFGWKNSVLYKFGWQLAFCCETYNKVTKVNIKRINQKMFYLLTLDQHPVSKWCGS